MMLTLATTLFLRQDKFGKLPTGAHLERLERSSNYKDGEFQNLEATPALSEEASYAGILYEFFFSKRERISPSAPLPSTKTNLFELDKDENILVWFGHSSYFMQVEGKKILVDPVFSGFASPFSFSVKAFAGTDRYSAADMPEIDYLFISHDHWDHLDYETLIELKPKIKKIICGLGVGAHFEHWGFETAKIYEGDWYDTIALDAGFTTHLVPTRHFSGRGFKRNPSLWTAFVLQTPTKQILIGGDSGYGKHFKHIGEKFGAFDLVILENGQYDKSWKYIHLMPDEVLQAAQDLNAKALFPVHSSKFPLANHAWDEPLQKITALNEAREQPFPLLTPIIGEKVSLDSLKTFAKWWER
ncbi:MBL fold metallo-hydrolase [Hugenholtzia roseola]|uniref:MBL fold metallo-hydrolase n=1 Tax=Hugenholtzia roseola TaxID=1002 RepID=UPI000551B6B4|nr:MBL fold metallo-hydrolase [Hugenholtzia roseola]